PPRFVSDRPVEQWFDGVRCRLARIAFCEFARKLARCRGPESNWRHMVLQVMFLTACEFALVFGRLMTSVLPPGYLPLGRPSRSSPGRPRKALPWNPRRHPDALISRLGSFPSSLRFPPRAVQDVGAVSAAGCLFPHAVLPMSA